MHRETHPNPNEYFPLRGKLGAPGGFPSIAALLAALAAALAAALMLQIGVVCTAISILPRSARIEARVLNWEEDTQVTWELAPYEKGQEEPSQLLQEGLLVQEVTLLDFQGLTPNTWYALWFYDLEDTARENLLCCFPFRTPGEPEPGSPPADPPQTPTEPPEPPTDPPQTPAEPPEPPADPPQTPTEPLEPPADSPQTPTEPPEPPTDPPVIPPDPPAPTLTPPTARTPELTGYTPPVLYTDDQGSYTITFTFDLNDAAANAISIAGQQSTYFGFGPVWSGKPGEQASSAALSAAFGTGDIQVDTAANTAQVSYTVPNAFSALTLTATLDYTMEDGTTGSVATAPFTLAPPFLYGAEADTANLFTYAVTDSGLEVTLSIRDLQQGTLPFQLTALDIWVTYDNSDGSPLPEIITPPPLPAAAAGNISYSFTIPLTDPYGSGEPAKAIYLSMDATADCYWNGAPMGLTSNTYCHSCIVLGASYTLDQPTLQFSDSFLAELRNLGLEMGGISLSSSTGGADGPLQEVLPGDTVDIWIWFAGTSNAEFQLIPNISASGELALQAAPGYVYQEEWQPGFWFSITMPERDVTAGEIVICDFIIQLPDPGEDTT